MAAKHSAVSSVITGPPICKVLHPKRFRNRSKESRWRGETDEFCCTSAFFEGYLLRRSLDFRYWRRLGNWPTGGGQVEKGSLSRSRDSMSMASPCARISRTSSSFLAFPVTNTVTPSVKTDSTNGRGAKFTKSFRWHRLLGFDKILNKTKGVSKERKAQAYNNAPL